MQRVGLPTFLNVMEIEPIPQHVKEPRSNPYVFWKEEEVEVVLSVMSRNSGHVTQPDTVWSEYFSIYIRRFIMGYDPDKPMEGRISDLGPPHYEQFLPPVIKENKGKWLWHEILQPGVLMHISETGAEVFTVRGGSARLVTVNFIREICDIADKHCDGYLRFTTRNNIEFMVDSKAKVQPCWTNLTAVATSSRLAAPAPV